MRPVATPLPRHRAPAAIGASVGTWSSLNPPPCLNVCGPEAPPNRRRGYSRARIRGLACIVQNLEAKHAAAATQSVLDFECPRPRSGIPMSLNTPAARRDLSYHLHPTTNLRTVATEGPMVITHGDGVYVYDDEGKRYLEGIAGLWCASLGFSEQRLAEAAHRQMRELPFYHAFSGKVPAVATELAERLIRIAPKGMRRAIFANSGSEANDMAIKLVWYYNNALGRPQKKKIISRQRAY